MSVECKIFCDRCGVWVPRDSGSHIKVTSNGTGLLAAYDLCSKCTVNIYAQLEPLNTDASPQMV